MALSTVTLTSGKASPEFVPPRFPFEIPEIVEEVIRYLAVDHLKKCRLISSTWDERSRRRMRNFVKVAFNDVDRVNEYISANLKYNEGFDLAVHFVFAFPPDTLLNHPSIQKLLENHGENVKSIYFKNVVIIPEMFKEVLLNKLPNLEELMVDPRPCPQLVTGRMFPPRSQPTLMPKIKHFGLSWALEFVGSPLLEELSKMFPNLEKVTGLLSGERNRFERSFRINDLLPIGGPNISIRAAANLEAMVEDFPYLSSHLIVFQLINDREGLPFSSLKDLNLRVIGSDSAVEKMLRKTFMLEKLDFTPTPSIDMDNIVQLFTRYRDTLTHFTIKFHPYCEFRRSFPQLTMLTNLVDLTIIGYDGHFTFLNSLVNLQKLTMKHVDMRKAILPPQGVPHLVENENMTTLEIFDDPQCQRNYAAYDDYIFIVLASTFANLTGLRIENASNRNLRSIFSHFTQLRKLHLPEGLFTDAGIVGHEIGRTANYPRISDLKCLMALKLESRYMTDESVLQGLVHCRNLEDLTLMSYQITDRAIKFLVDSDEVLLSSLVTEYCYQITNECKLYAENILRNRACKVSINAYNGPLKKTDIIRILKKEKQPQVVLTKIPGHVLA